MVEDCWLVLGWNIFQHILHNILHSLFCPTDTCLTLLPKFLDVLAYLFLEVAGYTSSFLQNTQANLLD